jgi:hypothetical protein
LFEDYASAIRQREFAPYAKCLPVAPPSVMTQVSSGRVTTAAPGCPAMV